MTMNYGVPMVQLATVATKLGTRDARTGRELLGGRLGDGRSVDRGHLPRREARLAVGGVLLGVEVVERTGVAGRALRCDGGDLLVEFGLGQHVLFNISLAGLRLA